VVGGALSLAVAMSRPKIFQSWVTLFYQERIQSSLLSPNREEVAQRNIGDRYRELLLARNQLMQILTDRDLDPFPPDMDPELKLDKLRQVVHFSARGAMAFRIEYTDSDPVRAKNVTARLTKLLQDKDEALRNEQAANTVAFVTEQKEAAVKELQARERKLNEFLAKNPAFVAEPGAQQSDGVLTSKANKASAAAAAASALRPPSVKERQLARIQARLDARPDAPAVPIAVPPSPERQQAEAVVKDAQRELAAAKRELEDAIGTKKFTPQHPTAIRAQERIDAAQLRLRQAEAAVPAEVETVIRPATAEDRAKLEKELAQLKAEIAAEATKTGRPVETQDTTTQRVVQLEIDNNVLRRDVAEQRERVQSLGDSAFRATMDANQKLAEQGGRLSIIDPAFTPAKPTGPPKTVFLMGGMVLFIGLGLSLAVGLAMIDDRLYRRHDLDALGVPVLAVIPPAIVAKHKPKPKPKRATPARAKTKGDVA
jgi:uncharacterized protein involved in exopolysaccharide biosynthesis